MQIERNNAGNKSKIRNLMKNEDIRKKTKINDFIECIAHQNGTGWNMWYDSEMKGGRIV